MSYDTYTPWTFGSYDEYYHAKELEPKEEPTTSTIAAMVETPTAPTSSSAPPPSDAVPPTLAVWEEQILSQNQSRPIWLPQALVRDFALHVVRNMDPTTRNRTPQLFAINGPFGCGKTSCMEELAYRMKMPVVRLAAQDLEDSTAHVPVQRIEGRYKEASALQLKHNRPAMFLVNDVDRVLAVREGKVHTTIHRRLADGTFMGLTDYPNLVGGTITERVVIVFTTNTLVDMYGGLTRPDRMRVFLMQPSPAEVLEVVTHMFRDILSVEQSHALVKSHPAWSLAAFSQVRSVLLEYAAYDRYRDLDIDHLHEQIMRLPDGRQNSLHRRCDDSELLRAVKAVEDEEHAKRDFTETK